VTERSAYRVVVVPRAGRELRRLPADVAARIRIALFALGSDPRPPGPIRLVDSLFWRVRVGDLRIVYLVDDVERMVRIERVVRRSESTYRRLQVI
jgi:mRNA interferase RelE/StbE